MGERQTRWKRKNRLAINKYRREWMKKNPKKRKEYERRYYRKHRDEINASRREYRRKNPEYGKKYTRRVREEIIRHYGGKCACCGIDTYEFLAIDHINGGGLEHRRQLKIEGQKLLFWLRREGYPKGFQILCHNCNLSLGHYGFCPHNPDVRRPVLKGKRK